MIGKKRKSSGKIRGFLDLKAVDVAWCSKALITIGRKLKRGRIRYLGSMQVKMKVNWSGLLMQTVS